MPTISTSFSRGAFFGELLLVCRLQVRDLRLIRSGIAETRRIVRIAWFIDLVQVELAGVRRHPDVGLVGRLHGESVRSEEHTSELQSLRHLVCRLLLEKK